MARAGEVSKRYWDDPLTFDPERWTGEDGSDRRDAFFAFGTGQRGCLGGGFAFLQMELALAAVARRWKVRPISEPAVSTFPFLQPRNGLPARMLRRP